MSTPANALALGPATRLQRIRRISRPLVFLITVALALAPVPLLLAAVLLVHPAGLPEGYVSFSEWGEGISVGHLDTVPPALVPIASLSAPQRWAFAAVLLIPTGTAALVLLQIRALFSLYCRGVIFGEQNARRIKHFALCLVANAVATNLAGRLFVAVIHAPVLGTSNAALVVVLGAMVYVIGYVMDLARDADLERKEFI